DFGLARRVLDDGLTLGERAGHHQVLRPGDGDGFQYQPRSLQALGTGLDVTILYMNVGAHRLQPRDVNVHRARADRAAARQRYVRMTETRHQWPEHQDGRTHRLDQLIGREVFADRRGIHLDAHALIDGDAHTHAAEQLDRGRDVLEVRHIADGH